MANFGTSHFSGKDIPEDDKGVNVEEVLALIKSNKFYDPLVALLNINEIIDEKIEIPGAKLLVSKIRAKNEEFEKFDLPFDFNNLTFKEDEEFIIKFNNIEDEDKIKVIGDINFDCKLKYSSKSDFFDGNFSMSKYANKLIKSGNGDLVFKNLELIKELYLKSKPPKRVYRILKDKEGFFYLRAIVSSLYNNYDNNITVLVGLIALHREMKSKNVKFSLDSCEYNESYIKAFFRKEGNNVINNVGKVVSIIEISNDEIKREPLKFSLLTSIIFGDDDSDKIYIKPRNVKYIISSIRHNLLPEKTIAELSTFSDYVEKENDIYKDLKKISKIKSPDQIRHLIYTKIDKTRQSELKSKNNRLLGILGKRIDTMYELLELLNKVNLIAEDIDAREYLRYLIYDVLTNKKSPEENVSDDEESD